MGIAEAGPCISQSSFAGLGKKTSQLLHFYLEAALRAALHLQLGGYLVRLALLRGNNSHILEAYLSLSGLTSPCW